MIAVTNKHTAKLHHVGSLYILKWKIFGLWVLRSRGDWFDSGSSQYVVFVTVKLANLSSFLPFVYLSLFSLFIAS